MPGSAENVEKAKQLLERQIEVARHLRVKPRDCPEFVNWHRNTEVAIEHIFGRETRHTGDFKSISYSLDAYSSETRDYEFTEAYQRGLDFACSILESMKEEVRDFGFSGNNSLEVEPLELILLLSSRFHLVARQLRARHKNRKTLCVEDEYDVQDLLHALLRLYFDDIRPEEWTPSYAGRSSRMDFFLKREQTVIEVKKTRKNLTAKELGEQLIVDIEKYQSHPECKCLICFVYDPEGRIANPKGIENDLNRDDGGIKVVVIIVPKGA